MSANLFSRHLPEQRTSSTFETMPTPTSQSRIPLRRWGSMRASKNSHLKLSKDLNQNTTLGHDLQVRGETVALRRGNSFMERGERRVINGVRSAAAVSRPDSITTEPRHTGALARAGQSPSRTKGLSLSLSNARVNSPRSPSSAFAASPKTPPASPELSRPTYFDWDADSLTSATSCLSVASCDHASVARNGTTFSGRSMKYVVHCSEHAGTSGEDYLTPTQRAHKQVKKLKYLLQQAQRDLNQKDSDILKLTKEVVELRLYKAALNSPEDKSNSSDVVTVRENYAREEASATDVADGPTGEMTNSYSDSGQFEDMTNSSVHSKDSTHASEDLSQSPYKLKKVVETAEKAVLVNLGPKDPNLEREELTVEYERRLQELIRTHEEDAHLLKQKHNDKVEELLQRLTEVNTRYWELVPELETARERIKELEQKLEEACKRLEEQEGNHKQDYLRIYNQGHEAAKLEHEKEVLEMVQENPNRISVPELLHQLQVTQQELDNIKDLEYASTSKNSRALLSAKEAVSLWVLGARKAMYRQLVEAKSKNKIDPEITLQFLKSAIYYFLTDRENNQGHLRAIQSILGFTPSEISNIDRARLY